MTRSTLTRSLHDVGLAAWFGGTLANAVALNPAASAASSDTDTGAVVNVGWEHWTPVNAAAIGAHLVGGIGQIRANQGRVEGQEGVAQMTIAKTGLTAVALGITAYSRVLGRKVAQHTRMPVSSGTDPAATTPPDVAAAQKQLKLLQWAIPAVTGAIVVLTSYAGEQQRPSEVQQGLVKRFVG